MAKVGVAGIIPRGKTVLVLRRSKTDAFLPGAYDLPGGGLDPGEAPEDGIVREVLEETGLQVSAVRSMGTRSYVLSDTGTNDKLLISFILKVEEGVFDVTLSEEHDFFRWVSDSDLDEIFEEGDLMGRIIHEYFSSVR